MAIVVFPNPNQTTNTNNNSRGHELVDSGWLTSHCSNCFRSLSSFVKKRQITSSILVTISVCSPLTLMFVTGHESGPLSYPSITYTPSPPLPPPPNYGSLYLGDQSKSCDQVCIDYNSTCNPIVQSNLTTERLCSSSGKSSISLLQYASPSSITAVLQVMQAIKREPPISREYNMICSVFKTHESKGPVTYWDTEQLFQDGAPVVMSVKDGASDLIKPTVFITERAADCTVVPPKSAFIVFSRVCACGH